MAIVIFFVNEIISQRKVSRLSTDYDYYDHKMILENAELIVDTRKAFKNIPEDDPLKLFKA
jgi:hypothetical protein